MSSSAAPPRPTYHHGDLHRALMDAARALMAEQQSWEFSLRELARRAGVSHNAPYKHFTDKHDLLAELAADGFERLTARMQQAAAGAATLEDALLSIALAYVGFGLDQPVYYRLMFGSGFKGLPDGLPPRVKAASAEAKIVLHDCIMRAAAAGILTFSAADHTAVRVAALEAWAVVHGLTMLFLDRLSGEDMGDVPPMTVARAVLLRSMTGLIRQQS